jgi:hypothetical protein
LLPTFGSGSWELGIREQVRELLPTFREQGSETGN